MSTCIDPEKFANAFNPKTGNIEAPKQEGYRDDEGKPPIHLIPAEAILMLANIFEYGSKKYGDRNWEKGMDWSRMYASAMRHMLAFWMGENDDRESGYQHMAHATWNCMALMCYVFWGIGFDDRPEL
mgnify:FL=1